MISSGARFKALVEGVLMATLDSKYTQVGFNLICVQVCMDLGHLNQNVRLGCEGSKPVFKNPLAILALVV